MRSCENVQHRSLLVPGVLVGLIECEFFHTVFLGHYCNFLHLLSLDVHHRHPGGLELEIEQVFAALGLLHDRRQLFLKIGLDHLQVLLYFHFSLNHLGKLESLLDLVGQYWKLAELNLVLHDDLIRDFFVAVEGDHIEASQQKIFEVGDMPVPGGFTPSEQLDLSVLRETDVVDRDVLVVDGVVEEILENLVHFVEKQQSLRPAEFLVSVVEFLNVLFQSFADFFYLQSYLVVGFLPSNLEIVYSDQQVAPENPVPVLVGARILLMKIELVCLRLLGRQRAADGMVGGLHKQGLVPLKPECTYSVDEAVLEIVGLVIDVEQNVQSVIEDDSIVAIIVGVEVDPEILVDDLEDLVIVPRLVGVLGDGAQLPNLLGRGEAEKTSEVYIKDPHIARGHHQEHALVDLSAKHYMSDIDANRHDLLDRLSIARVCQHHILAPVEQSNTVAEDIDGELHDEVLGLLGAAQEDVVVDFFCLLDQLVGLRHIAIQALLEQEDLPTTGPADETVLELDRQLVLDLDVTEGAAALKFELTGAHDELAVLGHVQYLQLVVVESEMGFLHINFLLLADEFAIAHVPIRDVEEEDLVSLLEEQPVVAAAVLHHLLEEMACVEGVSPIQQEGHLVLHRSQLLLQLGQFDGFCLVHLRVDFLNVDRQACGQVLGYQAYVKHAIHTEDPPQKTQEQLLGFVLAPDLEIKQVEGTADHAQIVRDNVQIFDSAQQRGHEDEQVHLGPDASLEALVRHKLQAGHLETGDGCDNAALGRVLELIVENQVEHLADFNRIGEVQLQVGQIGEVLGHHHQSLAQLHLEVMAPPGAGQPGLHALEGLEADTGRVWGRLGGLVGLVGVLGGLEGVLGGLAGVLRGERGGVPEEPALGEGQMLGLGTGGLLVAHFDMEFTEIGIIIIQWHAGKCAQGWLSNGQSNTEGRSSVGCEHAV